jgi:3-phenylpropionate/trans-cinnamate dioxygenase ferredoxin reductase component
MSSSPTFLIVGAGLAAAKAAETLRAEGFGGRLLLFGDEAERPYERPPLSKGYLRGETDRASLYVHQDGFYASHDIELRTSSPVRSIDPAHHRVELASGEGVGYDRLLLATGAAPRRLPLPGADHRGRPAPAGHRHPEALALQGKAAVAQARLAYRLFRDRFSGPRWAALAARGAPSGRCGPRPRPRTPPIPTPSTSTA